jgi:hypothetical protein
MSSNIQRNSLAEPGKGDVVLMLRSYGKETLVNAKVLSDASPIFKEVLDKGAENRAPRSSTNPQELEAPTNVEEAHVLFLCGILHGHRPTPDYPVYDGTTEE